MKVTHFLLCCWTTFVCVVPSFVAINCFFIRCIRCAGKPLLWAKMSILLHSSLMAYSKHVGAALLILICFNKLYACISWTIKCLRSSASQEIPAFYGTPKIHYSIHKNLSPVPILARSIQSTPPSHILKIQVNIMLPSTPASSKWSLSFMLHLIGLVAREFLVLFRRISSFYRLAISP